nr:retrovirus-related Pol polyprotein from transposon TNT 1-94 [Tanacetum cinerariifolium]
MTTLAKHMIVADAEIHPPMLDKTMYNSWQSQKLQDDCDVQATNIVLQGLPPDVYSLVNHCFVVPSFLPGDDLIACHNKAMEVLVYITATCPSLTKPSEKFVGITPLNKNKKVRFAEHAISSSNTLKRVDSNKIQDSNKPVLPSTGIKSSTSASRSQPLGNTNNNRISRTTSSNQKNKVKDQCRRVKSNLNNTYHAIKPVYNANVKHSMLNANSELICATCNECMFDAIHDLCVLDFVNDVNVHSKSKSAKSSKKKNIWKPTGKVFTNTGYRWKPTGRTFTIVGNTCPLTRITSTKANHIKENTSKSVTTPNLNIKIYRNRSQLNNFVYKFLDVGISHQTSVAHSPQQNNVVERQNRTLVEAARTMLIFSKALLFLWAETVVTACYTQNKSLIHKCHNKTPYELLHNRKPDLSYLFVFGALCYPTNDCEDLGKLKPKADIKIFVGYAPAKKAYQIYNKRTRLIIETIHVEAQRAADKAYDVAKVDDRFNRAVEYQQSFQ